MFRAGELVYRQVNQSYAGTLRSVEESGLYDCLTERGLLVQHEPANIPPVAPDRAARIILPEQIPFVSYPYEWCFGQLKDAATATLTIQLLALQHGMTLKDASAFNIQFLHGRPILIDTLSFEPYIEGKPWTGYRQFCEHFLGPLMLARFLDPSLTRLSILSVDGIALETISRLLPASTWLRPSTLLHVHLHARSIRHFGGRAVPSGIEKHGLSKRGMTNLVEGLLRTVQSIEFSVPPTEWANYEAVHSYSSEEYHAKTQTVRDILETLDPGTVWDLGANTGTFSRMACALGAHTVSIDADHSAVEISYRRMKDSSERRLHPLWVDLLAPSGGVGWANEERDSLSSRCDADVVLALAIVHHLAIGANIPLTRIVEWFSRLSPHLIIEFVPKSDPQTQRLLVSRDDIFADYTRSEFERTLGRHFEVQLAHELTDSGRTVYHGIRR